MAERKPRSFAAMREDRVLDMASRRFGRQFTSKADAVRALSALPVADQHAIPKRADPGRPRRPAAYNNTAVLDRMRGGVAKSPEALKLVDAVYDKPRSVMRLAQATTNIKATSPSQALTLLSKFGGTDMKRSATQAYSEIAHSYGGRIPAWPKDARQPVAKSSTKLPAVGTQRLAGPRKAVMLERYQDLTGQAASPRATRAWLSSEIGAAESRVRANRVSAGIQATALATTVVGTYRRKRAEQTAEGSAGDWLDKGRAAGSAAYAAAPGIAALSVQKAALHASHKYVILPFGLQFQNPIKGAAATVAKGAGRAVLPALALWSIHRAAQEDTSALRGAGRGLVRALDPTAILLDKGLAERAYNKVFKTDPPLPTPGVWDHVTGRAGEPPFVRAPNAYRKFLDRNLPGIVRGSAYLDAGAMKAAAVTPPTASPVASASTSGMTMEPGRQPKQSYVTTDGRSVQATAAQVRRYEAQKAP